MSSFKLLALPPEIRVEIYSHLLPRTGAPFAIRNVVERKSDCIARDHPPLRRTQYDTVIGLIDPKVTKTTYCLKSHSSHTTGQQTPMITETWGPFPRSSYYLSDSTSESWDPYDANAVVALLQASKLVNKEATPLLYSHYKFDFDTHLNAFRHFIFDLRPSTRRHIRKLRLVKKALPFERSHEKFAWATACNVITRELDVTGLDLDLGIEGARVIDSSSAQDLEQWWDLCLPREEKEELLSDNSKVIFEAMVKRILDKGTRDWLEIDWVAKFVGILRDDVNQERKLKNLEVKAIWEECFPPSGQAMKWFVSFSEKIENGFMEYLKERMVGGCDKSKEAD